LCWVFFEIKSCKLFAWAGLKHNSSDLCPLVARITRVRYPLAPGLEFVFFFFVTLSGVIFSFHSLLTFYLHEFSPLKFFTPCSHFFLVRLVLELRALGLQSMSLLLETLLWFHVYVLNSFPSFTLTFINSFIFFIFLRYWSLNLGPCAC
jgi:hypothetical protein